MVGGSWHHETAKDQSRIPLDEWDKAKPEHLAEMSLHFGISRPDTNQATYDVSFLPMAKPVHKEDLIMYMGKLLDCNS